jgi:GTP-binding protein
MKFIDQTKIKVFAGNGGDGVVSFAAAKNAAKLGPDGGNGGNGGSIYMIADRGLNTLSTFRHHQIFTAEPGNKGGPSNRKGRCGDDLFIKVPCGSLIFEEVGVDSVLVADLVTHGQQALVAQGGKRGYGNLHYASPTNRAPRQFTNGQAGQERFLRLELKLLADVGLAGFPNAGKSTLLSKVSAAKPKIADYPFTTLTPNLGVVDLGEYGLYDASYVMADIPGLIPGASLGKGLGLQFLRHLERTKIIAYIIDAFPVDEKTPMEVFLQLRQELSHYSAEFLGKKILIVLNKIDLFGDEMAHLEKVAEEFTREVGAPVLMISGIAGRGIKELKLKIYELLKDS